MKVVYRFHREYLPDGSIQYWKEYQTVDGEWIIDLESVVIETPRQAVTREDYNPKPVLG